MAGKARYPQIPSTVWWGLRGILQKTPNTTIDERLLAIQLGVQPAAAKAYISELKFVGLLSEDSRATSLALRWRLDEKYSEAVREIVSKVYPQQLIDIAPPGEADRNTVVSWFQHEGFGSGAAGNKAAAYLLLSSPSPNDSPKSNGKDGANESRAKARPKTRANSGKKSATTGIVPVEPEFTDKAIATGPKRGEHMPLNVNVQIHISADAGAEQIESIFQAMRRYLYDAPSA